ncbi:MAG: hypothetical protein CYG60_23930 [Actinobacteria bacterium]|nr:MAG: hypothetical protein CYG60_23930 [Actinomycetota bacterium]
MDSERDGDTRYVLLDSDMSEHVNGMPSGMSPDMSLIQTHLDSLQDQIDFLRAELERKDAILLTMAQRIPELEPAREAPLEPRESPMTASDNPGGGTTPTPEEVRRPWWLRWLGG